MIERPVAFAALSAPFVWVVVELVPHLPGAAAAVVVAASVGLAVGILTLLQPEAIGIPNVGVAAGLVLVAAAATAAPGALGPYGPAIFVGLLVGVPWMLVGFVARSASHVGARFVTFGLAVSWGLLLLAAAPGAIGTGGSAVASSYLSQLAATFVDQFRVFGGLLPGAAIPPLPVNQFFDPTYAFLVAVAIGGLLLVTIRPQTGARSPLPVAVRGYHAPEAERELTGSYGFSAAQQAVFRERSTGDVPLATWPPGLEPVFFGAAAAGTVLLAAFLVPLWAVPAGVAGVGVAALWLVRTTERPMPLPRPRLPPPSDETIAPPESAPSADSVVDEGTGPTADHGPVASPE